CRHPSRHSRSDNNHRLFRQEKDFFHQTAQPFCLSLAPPPESAVFPLGSAPDPVQNIYNTAVTFLPDLPLLFSFYFFLSSPLSIIFCTLSSTAPTYHTPASIAAPICHG